MEREAMKNGLIMLTSKIKKQDVHSKSGVVKMDLKVEDIKTPKDCNIICGTTHFIKTAVDLYETLAESSSSIKFGLAFNEASGDCLVRSEGNDDELRKECEKIALQVGVGHFFVILIKNAYPINVLNRIKSTSEVCNVLCATANPLQIIIAETSQGRSVVGVVDGFKPKGVENEKQKNERRELMRKFKYKL